MSVNFSYSKMDTYDKCGFKYKLIYEDGHYTYTDSIATEFGTLIHATEEAIAKAIKAKQPIDYTQLKNNIILKMASLAAKYPEPFITKDKSDRTYTEKMYYYLEHGIYRLEQFMQAHPSYQIVGIEQKFEFEYSSNYHFKGFIDRVFYDTATNKYIIQDIKTYAVPVEHKDLTTPLQFVFYVLAAKNLYNCDESQLSCQYDLPLCDLTQDAGTTGYMTRGVKKIQKLLENIEHKEFSPSPSALCHWCPFCPTNNDAKEDSKYLCPYFMKRTREHKTFEKEFEWQGVEMHKKIMEEYNNEVNFVKHQQQKL